MFKQARQGDVFIEEASITIDNDFEQIPKDAGRIILAYGEATGHAHAIKDTSSLYFKNKKTSKIYLVVNNPTEITHEEHKEIPLKPSIYEVIRQVEYTPEEIRYVAD